MFVVLAMHGMLLNFSALFSNTSDFFLALFFFQVLSSLLTNTLWFRFPCVSSGNFVPRAVSGFHRRFFFVLLLVFFTERFLNRQTVFGLVVFSVLPLAVVLFFDSRDTLEYQYWFFFSIFPVSEFVRFSGLFGCDRVVWYRRLVSFSLKVFFKWFFLH